MATLNDDQMLNLERLIREQVQSFFRVRRYYALLEGLHTGALDNPDSVKRFPELYDELWRALYDALFAAVGTIIDHGKSVHSLKNLLTTAIRYLASGDALSQEISEIRRELESSSNETIGKLKAWRHNVVAHRTDEGIDPQFYERHKMTLKEVGAGIEYLEGIFNGITLALFSTLHDLKWNTKSLQAECAKAMRLLGIA